MKGHLFLLGFSILISIFVSEIALRMFWVNPYKGSGVDRVLTLRLPQPNLNQTFDRRRIDPVSNTVSFRTNARSYIEPSVRFEKPDITIAFLGGSTTACVAVKEEMRFPFLVSKNLEGLGIRANALNAARDGSTLHDLLNLLLNHVVLDHPNIIVLMEATNDIGVLAQDPQYRSRMGHDVDVVSIGKYALQLSSSHSYLLGLLRKFVTFPGYDRLDERRDTRSIKDPGPFENRLRAFVAISRSFGATPVIMTQPIAANIRNELTPSWTDPNAQAIFNQRIRSIGKEMGVHVIDLESQMKNLLERGEDLNKVFYDGIHVTDYGSSIYATHITDELYELIRTSKPKSE